MRRVALLLFALFVVVLVAGCGSPQQSVKMFLKYRIQNDTNAAKLYSTDQVDESIDEGEFTVEALGFGNPYGKAISWEGEKGKINLNVVSEDAQSATITNGSGPKKVTFHLIRTGGMWKIDDITPAQVAAASPSDFGAITSEEPPPESAAPGEASEEPAKG